MCTASARLPRLLLAALALAFSLCPPIHAQEASSRLVPGGSVQTSLSLRGSRSEFSATSDGATASSSGFVAAKGALTLRGTGALRFDPAPDGPGIVFAPGGQQNSDTAFVAFQGLALAQVFNLEKGEVNLTLKSNLTPAERVAQGYQAVFDAFDSNRRIFALTTTANSSYAAFIFTAGDSGAWYYYVTAANLEGLFGKGKQLNIRHVWDGSIQQIYFNGTKVGEAAYKAPVAVWTRNASLTIGAQDVHLYAGGFYGCVDTISNFEVKAYVPPPDTQPPSAPGTPVATPVSAGAIALTWPAASDDIGVSGYEVYRDGLKVATVAETAYVDTGLAAATSYRYVLRALDAAGNRSTPTAEVIPATRALNDPMAFTPVVEWQIQDGPLLRTAGGALGASGVTAELRPTLSTSGVRYDVRLRNRTQQTFSHTALRVRLPRAGGATAASSEGLSLAVPAEIYQGWALPGAGLTGAAFGFFYELRSDGVVLKKVGPSTRVTEWGGRASGVMRIDGRAYVIPEFWQRQPRRITVTATEIVLTLFEGEEPLRSGEDAWDRCAFLSENGRSDAQIADEAEGLPRLSAAQRQALLPRFAIAPEGLHPADGNGEREAILRKWDRWQGCSWEGKYGDEYMAKTIFNPDGRSTLFGKFAAGGVYAVNSPEIYQWRDWGDMTWADGHNSLHYDWCRHAFRHYLRTGNEDALRWAMAAMRHITAVDFLWATTDLPQFIGLSRYEKGEHGDGYRPTTSHTWAEGLFIAAAVTNDPWVQEAALRRADCLYSWFGGTSVYKNDAHYEIRAYSWPLLILTRAAQETGDAKYWTKAKELMDSILRGEQGSGGKGYIGDPNTHGVVSPLNVAYAGRALVAFADEAIKRGEWKPEWEALVERMATFMTTPWPNGPYFPPSDTQPSGLFNYVWYPPATAPAGDHRDYGLGEVLNMHLSDPFSWLAKRNPARWAATAQRLFSDAVYHGPHPLGRVGFLSNKYPATECKAMGWMQLFTDRAALWLADSPPPPESAPVILQEPADQNGQVSKSVTFSLSASANPDPSYQWQEKRPNAAVFSDIAAAKGPVYLRSNLSLVESGTLVRCIVTNSKGNATSRSALLQVFDGTPPPPPPAGPQVTRQPQDCSVNEGERATFSIAASGTGVLQYQWQSNAGSGWSNISGATSDSCSWVAGAVENGVRFRCAVTDSVGSVNSASATLWVWQAPVLTSQPTATPNPADVNQPIAFVVAASDPNGDVLTFTWDFGDGSSAAGDSVVHAYSSPGLYSVALVVSDGRSEVRGSLEVTIRAGGGGTPQPQPQPLPLQVSKLAIKLNFASAGKDSAQVTGALTAAEAFAPKDVPVVVSMGAYQATCVLDAKGKGRSATGSFRLQGKSKRGVYSAGALKFTYKVGKSELAAPLQPLGLVNADVSKPGVQLTLPVRLTLGAVLFAEDCAASYVAQSGKNGLLQNAAKAGKRK